MKTNKTLARLFALMLTVLLLAGAVTAMAASVYDDNGDGRVDVLDLLSLLLKMENGEEGVTVDTLMNAVRHITHPDAPDPSKHYDFLFIGNSYTYYNEMPAMFERIAAAAGYTDLTVSRVTAGGWTLLQHANPNDQYGKKVEAELAKGIYDYVILQEQSLRPVTEPGLFYDGVRAMEKKVRDAGAEPILYQTWGRKTGHSALAQNGLTNETMTWKLAAAYRAIAEELSIDSVAPVGYAFFDVYTAEGNTIELYDPDMTHSSPEGSYLAALTIFAEIFGIDPTGLTISGFDAAEAAVLQEAAYKAVFETPTLPEEYKTSSEGVVGNYEIYEVDASQRKMLTAIPQKEMLTVLTGDGPYPNGKSFSGILGSKNQIASTAYSDTALTAEQKADIADIGYGVSVIGIEKMDSTANGYKTAVENLVNGHWGGSYMAAMVFDDTRYDIKGNAASEGSDKTEFKYRALITLNFGKKQTFDAIGFFSGNLYGFPGAGEVFVSDDGSSWTRVPTACWDALNVNALSGVKGSLPADPWNGNTSPAGCLFDMGGAEGQYIRLGIVTGRYDQSAYHNTINTRELVVYGGKDIAPSQTAELSALPSSKMISVLSGGTYPNGKNVSGILGSKNQTASAEYSTTALTAEQKADIADIGYGVSVIGVEKMGTSTAVENLVNGEWGTKMCNLTFDDSLYTVDGKAGGADASYRALITLNFGKKQTFDALGFFSGNLKGFPGAADVYVSDDGKEWTKVPTACWNALEDKALSGVSGTLPTDFWDGKKPIACALFDMGGVSGQYIRLGVITGRYDSSSYYNTINTRELVVYGAEK
ncbi:MAG: hypothetical protein E7655_07960 [Ruminococcaceae bacterium]|nr:hypothetical protein [Oscillospiraceae bacterium]